MCDRIGCRNPFIAAEVYPGNATWSYLCKKCMIEDKACYGGIHGYFEFNLKGRIKATLDYIWLRLRGL